MNVDVLPSFVQKNRSLRSNLQDPKIYSPAIWNELRIFLAVAKNRSFNSAAIELGVSQPTVSRAVKSLERNLDQTLVLADQRGVSLTSKGEEIALVASSLDLSLSNMTFHLRKQNSKLSGDLSIKASGDIASTWLAPLTARLAVSNPGLRCSFFGTNEDNTADIEITTTKSKDSSAACEQIGFLHYVAVVSHSYIDRNDTPILGDLEEHNFIQLDAYKANKSDFADWNKLTAKMEQVSTTASSDTYINQARLGVGIAFVPNFASIANEFVPLDLKVSSSKPLYLVSRSNEEIAPKIDLMTGLIRETIAEANWFQEVPVFRPAGSRTEAELHDLF